MNTIKTMRTTVVVVAAKTTLMMLLFSLAQNANCLKFGINWDDNTTLQATFSRDYKLLKLHFYMRPSFHRQKRYYVIHLSF